MPSPYGPPHDTSSTESVGLLPYTSGDGNRPTRISDQSSVHQPTPSYPYERPPMPNHPLDRRMLTPSPAAGDEAGFPGGYNRHYSASVESHMSGATSIGPNNPFADIPGSSEPYPAWSAERQIPMSTEEIEDIFLDLAQKFGFQKDSMRNMVRPPPFTSRCLISLPCLFPTPC